MFTEADATRFWAKVDKSGECWVWTGRPTRAGYGQFQVGGRPHPAHRVSWMLTNGPIPEGRWILHSCDNPPCVNPAHLRVGTVADNNADMVERHRDRRFRDPMEHYVELGDAARLLGVTRDTLRQQIRRGRLVGFKSATWMVKRREVERYRTESLGKRRAETLHAVPCPCGKGTIPGALYEAGKRDCGNE